MPQIVITISYYCPMSLTTAIVSDNLNLSLELLRLLHYVDFLVMGAWKLLCQSQVIELALQLEAEVCVCVCDAGGGDGGGGSGDDGGGDDDGGRPKFFL